MKKTLFNQGWAIANGVEDPFVSIFGGTPVKKEVMLPQDAMILEERDENCNNHNQSGYYPSKTYTYTKEIMVPEDWKEKQTWLEFEGVMSKAMVYINGEFAGKNKFGYSQFYVDLNRYVRFGKTNTIKVIAINQGGNSRWYSGSGIYRNVCLHQGGMVHVVPDTVRITTETLEDKYAVLTANAGVQNSSNDAQKILLKATIIDKQGKIVAECENTISLLAGESVISHMRFTVDEPNCWSPDSPTLYCAILEIYRSEDLLDQAEETFGIRTLALDARQGLRINGKSIKLRGACIHHDNGIIGATTLYQAEEFRLKKMKEAGFNSIRSAHHPASKAILEACDKLGLLVMDELSDMWDDLKNSGDMAIDFNEDWQAEMAKMVAKDYNHPSVVLYSIGNEIPEIGRRSGGRRTREFVSYLRSLDHSRYVTCAFSGFLAVAGQTAEATDAVAEDAQQKAVEVSAEAEKATYESASSKESSGSEGLNNAMANTQKAMLNAFSISSHLSACLEEPSCELDVVGYNYLTARHEYEHTIHPDRVILGSETYPTEIADLWRIVKRNPYVIGDFTWVGYDYVGEAGIGCYHYDTERMDQGWFPDRLAYCGDININGYRRPVSYLREIAFGLRKEPFLAVERVNRYGHHYNTNDWKYKDSLDSWTFDGWEGKPANIHVLSASEEVELFLNGKSLGRKSAGDAAGFDVLYEAVYEPGELLVVGYTGGIEDGRFVLTTAGEPVEIQVDNSCDTLQAGGQEITFLTIDLVDANGVVNHWANREVTVEVSGEGILAGFGSANPSSEDSYQDSTAPTYDGRIMAAIRSGMHAGTVEVTVSAEGCKEQKYVIKVIE